MENNQFTRLELLIGKENVDKIKKTKVLVLGLGGVGSYVVESLIRSGVSDITLVDFDTIDITNLNRQLMTNLDNIGEYKVDVLEKRIKSINEDVKIKKIKDFIDLNNIDILFNDNPSYIIDCCDSIPTKKELIRKCLKRKIKFITCMGTGNKLDPSKLEIIDVRKTSYDPIAKIIRKFLKDERLNGKVLCCCSREMPIKTNSKIIGSTSFVPSSAGLLITSYVIRDIINEKK